MKKLLIVVYSLFLVFLVGSAIFAAKTFDGDFDNAYETGMQYPAEIEKIKNLGWKFAIANKKIFQNAPAEIELVITDNNDDPVAGAKVALELSMLTKSDGVPGQKASEQMPGHYVASVVLPYYGHWRVDSRIMYGGEIMQHNFRIYVEEGITQ